MSTQTTMPELMDVAHRIREMREIMGYSEETMAQRTEVTLRQYRAYEKCEADLPFTFIYKCALAFGIELTELLEGRSAKLRSYNVTRRGMGQQTAKEDGISIANLAPEFRNKIAEPYWVKYEYSPELQNKPIHLTRHNGQEFDLVISGSLLVQVGTNRELLHEGDSIYYNSSTPHGMIAVDGKDCVFCAVVLPGEDEQESVVRSSVISTRPSSKLLCEKFVETEENENGTPVKIAFKNTETFNFGFDVVDEIAEKYPDKLAMIHLDKHKNEKDFTFSQIKKESARVANYFKSLGIKRAKATECPSTCSILMRQP